MTQQHHVQRVTGGLKEQAVCAGAWHGAVFRVTAIKLQLAISLLSIWCHDPSVLSLSFNSLISF